jgi:hypothetical protein
VTDNITKFTFASFTIIFFLSSSNTFYLFTDAVSSSDDAALNGKIIIA